MTRIGKAYFGDEFRWGIVPNLGYGDEDKYLVILQNGVKVTVAASEAQIQHAMEGLGYDPETMPGLFDILDEDEREEILPLMDQGYRWIAKDKRKITQAFLGEPELNGAYWSDPNEGPSQRLFCDYAFLDVGESIDLNSYERREDDE